MLRSLSLLSLAGVAGILFACSPIEYGTTASDDLDIDLPEEGLELAIAVTADMPARDGAPARLRATPRLSVGIITDDGEALIHGELWDGNELLIEADSIESTRWNDDEKYPIQVLSLNAEAFENCGWRDHCERDLTLVLTGASGELLEITVDLSVHTADKELAALSKAELSITID